MQQVEKNSKSVKKKYVNKLYEFKNSEELTGCILAIYKFKKFKNINSSLYKTNKGYCLILKSPKNCKSHNLIKEFCNNFTFSQILIEKVEEYEKILIAKKAIEIYGAAFSREP